ncbi:immunity protein Imm33 domain-containing protein [Streptococcus sp. KHUD_014]|uniref:immunity protein Imm33 domain-containing protein n=1 Tax=Streptococcus sp. KHUD_014 TaxID=3434353 RepID=UPI003DA43B53
MSKIGMGLGASIVSNNILENKAHIKWILREDSVDELDNGWRFLSEIDTEEYLSHAENMSICDWSTIVEIEPAVLSIFNMPIGTELTIIYEDERLYFLDTITGQKLSQ